LVIKPSGFSPEAWGSRGVVMGHDVSSQDWGKTLDRALAEFPHQPYILQEFHKGKRIEAAFWNSKTQSMDIMESRARLTPYYFVVENQARLGGILATLCGESGAVGRYSGYPVSARQKENSWNGGCSHGALCDRAGELSLSDDETLQY
jgi:hypothetical protein